MSLNSFYFFRYLRMDLMWIYIFSFLSTLCSHIAERSLIKFPLTLNWRCFTPNLLVKSPKISEMRYKHLSENLASIDHISEGFAGDAKQQLPKLESIAKEKRQEFLAFDHTSESYWLGYFFMNHIGDVKCLENWVKVMKIILMLLHHSYARLKGFSVNK